MVKFLLLALAFGLAHAKLEGKWKTIAIIGDDLKKIENGGPLNLYIREITCEEECKQMKVTFCQVSILSRIENEQCSLTTVTGYLQQDGETYSN
nr:odorant-binding protein 1a-like [Rattus norvegicus]|eukprot:XP_006257037.1 PREDICTED: odorant-binding protein 1a-like [Rattus norvegicus]